LAVGHRDHCVGVAALVLAAAGPAAALKRLSTTSPSIAFSHDDSRRGFRARVRHGVSFAAYGDSAHSFCPPLPSPGDEVPVRFTTPVLS
jgi:hypothetical protein